MHVGTLRPKLSSDLAGAATARFRETDERSAKGVRRLIREFSLGLFRGITARGSDGR